MKEEKDTTIFNCHAHIFTIDHVPNEFGRTFVPRFLSKILTIKLVKWYYNNFTSRGNYKYKKFRHSLKKIKYGILQFCKWTFILYWLILGVSFILKWVFKIITSFLKVDYFFSKELRDITKRFLTLGRYSLNYKSQARIYDLLEKTYERNTKIVVLSMDMDYMEAGKPEIKYLDQLEELKIVKKNNIDLLPFIFLDPRRVKETKSLEGKKNYATFLKSELQKGNFNGIKLYPALGYYPFDKELVNSYLFAQENNIPIMTHCIEGTVFYRGKKKPEWNYHPILTYNKKGTDNPEPIPLPQSGNYQWTTNFTHPMNYHCLLDKELLSNYLGYECDLSKLKICLAHFGGSKEWKKYETDGWNNYNKNISHASEVDYLKIKNTLNHKSKRTIWWNASWLSIIYDLMIKYENVYADVSFILFNEKLFPMLKFILNDPKVSDKILYGTDYYVVTQKKTEKSLHQNLRSYIGEELFFKIANKNPKQFLTTNFKDY
ncbi:amidohydrolase family protein [Polaribacter batillariae]|uniref:Amidohydrolase family protein n=1 Tax=Polaribacter batillariae TaxID=2808900 RepID=A0ABX7SZA4_9FLAO|nr:amidohydrolase family protein [Polaribacter batillariae]QTD39034.1 amidohydrolase family protein [Polaribacter batillariae]